MTDPVQPAASPVMSFVIAVVLLFAAIYLSFPAVKILLFAEQSRSWPVINGQVASSEVESLWASREDGVMQAYMPRVWYAYYLDGQNYISDQMFPGQGWMPFRYEAQSVAARYPQGAKVKIYYDPACPASSVLEPDRVPVMVNIRLGSGVVFAFWALLSLGELIKRIFADGQA